LPVKIRLARGGRKKIDRYRIVAADSRNKRDGRFLENLGSYNPQAQPKEFTINTERVAYWINKGAQPTETVKNLLREDRFAEKAEAIEKGVDPASIERKAERKRKPKAQKNKAS